MKRPASSASGQAGGKRVAVGVVVGLAITLALIAIPVYAIKVDRKRDYTDFEVYYKAAKRAQLGQWDQIYTLSDGASPFRYAPPLIPLLRPLAELELVQAKRVWYGLQVIWFALGFWCLSRALRLTRVGRDRGTRHAITAVAFLFVLRFCLDCFTIGQVSSLLFLGYAAGMYAWMARKPGRAGLGLLVPSAFKIGPGFLFSLLAAARSRRERERAIVAPLVAIVAGIAAFWAWCWDTARFKSLWAGWFEMVAKDSQYYDASHYGSQSIKSALLRSVKSGSLSVQQAEGAYLAAVVLGCLAILLFWCARRPRTPLGRGAFYTLGVFPYLWFMPETFKYSLTTLALPVTLLLAERSATSKLPRLSLAAIAFGALSLSLAGLDLVGTRVFFALQYASVPLMATLLLGAATWVMAWRQSRPAWVGTQPDTTPWQPWHEMPQAAPTRAASLLIALPMQSTSRLNASWIRKLVTQAEQALPSDSEILLIPFGNRASREHPAWREAARLAAQGGSLRLIEPTQTARGGALRDGFIASRGRLILALNAEQPCELDFFQAATHLTTQGTHVVRANRRLAESRFRVPVRDLKLVYGRHRLGLLFNRLVRAALPIQSTDTHSGNWLMTREAATAVFALQRSPGFLFDLEAWITAESHGFKQKDLPVTLTLTREKTSRRVGIEAWAILRGLPRLWLRTRQGYYHPRTLTPHAITADDWGLTPGVNQGILELARLGVVKRVSLMAYGTHLREGLPELKQVPGLSLGLHFDLTLGKAQPAQILWQWLKPGADRAQLAQAAQTELRKQLALVQAAGVRPAHLDGHHHIHLVPGLLDALAPVIREAGIRAVRLPQDPRLLWRKPLLWLLTRQARASHRKHGFESAPCYYPQPGDFADQAALRAKLASDPSAEVIVHPASHDDLAAHDIPDPYTSGRVTEYRALRMLSVTQPQTGAT